MNCTSVYKGTGHAMNLSMVGQSTREKTQTNDAQIFNQLIASIHSFTDENSLFLHALRITF